MTSTSSHMSSCVLDEQNFRRCCRLLLQQSEQLNDGWSWEPVQDSEEGYLRKTTLRSVVINSSTVWDLEGSSSESEPYTSCHFRPDQLGHESEQSVPIALDETDTMEDDIDDDDEGDGVCAVTKGSSKVLQYEYHIMYSCSYSTPVLYFRASTLQGRSLSLEEVWSSVHPNFRLRLQNSPLNTISMQDRRVYAACDAGSSGATQASELRVVVAQCGGSCGGSGRHPEVLPAPSCSLHQQH
ncbi:ubiquitin-like-conjugating enzyme ATG10 isoform X3 [Acanthopagrus latus]|uniref:ubiquitin-like-conjugating enzyme ATG10 isoform X3 n=1 Tax=Acanthopagrus latus TaxID=8177 RepID=UPI00187C201C|nr:ubiquitin-like-conjugating enzyme ATG10 isoform X3 [Acanthopagrus latus]